MGLNGIVYYLQMDLISLFLVLFVFASNYSKMGNRSTEDRIFNMMLVSTALFCVADFLTWFADGKMFQGARSLVFCSNIFYIAYPPIISFIWTDYVVCRSYGSRYIRTVLGKVHAICAVITAMLVISTPVSGFAFSVDKANVYHREIGAYIAPCVAWFFILYTFCRLFVSLKTKGRTVDKDMFFTVLYFMIPSLVCTVIQILNYGVTLIQFGFTVSLLSVFINKQSGQISLDELTGLNNRRELTKFFEKVAASADCKDITVCLIDVDKFKSINDTYGHIEGDAALVAVSSMLQKACSNQKLRWFLARYGGDEFVIAGYDRTTEEIKSLEKRVNELLEADNTIANRQYTLSCSFGYSTGKADSVKAIYEVLHNADNSMYKNKRTEA